MHTLYFEVYLYWHEDADSHSILCTYTNTTAVVFLYKRVEYM